MGGAWVGPTCGTDGLGNPVAPFPAGGGQVREAVVSPGLS